MKKTITVRGNYSHETTTIMLTDGVSATKRQYEAAAKRCALADGDYLRRGDDGTEIVVWDGARAWAVIA